MDSNAIAFAEKALLAGAVPDRIRKQLNIDFGVHVTAKFLQNIKQRVIGNYLFDKQKGVMLVYEFCFRIA